MSSNCDSDSCSPDSVIEFFAGLGSSSASSGGLETLPFFPDYDRRVRKCNLQVVTRPTDGGGLAKHISLFFVWEDRKALYEAFEHRGKMSPTWANLESLADSRFKTWIVEEDYTIECSPEQVNKVAKNLPMNGQVYKLTTRNCYWWARELAYQLGVRTDFSAWAVLLAIPGLSVVVDAGHKLSGSGISDSCKELS